MLQAMSERAMEWMRFNPVTFGLLATDLGPEGEGYLIRLVRHLWQRGPLTREDAIRVTGRSADAILPLMVEVGGLLSLQLVEDARAHGKAIVAQRKAAGEQSAAKRNERSTTVERPLNDRSTTVLSRSMSESPSGSNSQEGGTGETALVVEVPVVVPPEPTRKASEPLPELIYPPWATERFIGTTWPLWKRYKAERRESYKPIGERAALSKLAHEYQTEEAAIEAIKFSMGNNYAGIFPAKTSTNGHQPSATVASLGEAESVARSLAILEERRRSLAASDPDQGE